MITSIDSLRKTLDSLKKKRYDMFIYGFNIINAKLKEVYQLLTETGDAELELIDSLDPFYFSHQASQDSTRPYL
jgi:structural maintenance of chromosome 4